MSLNGQIFTATLDHMHNSGMLAPGAKERLIQQSARSTKLTPAEMVGELIAFMLSDEAKPYFRPGFKFPDEATPLFKALEMLPLASGARDKLAMDWHLDLVALEPEMMGTKIIERLGQRENWKRLDVNVRPDLPVSERRVLDALRHFRDEIAPGVDINALATKWGSEIGHGPAHEVARSVADRITNRPEIRRYDEAKFNYNDPIFRPAPLSDEQRAIIDSAPRHF